MDETPKKTSSRSTPRVEEPARTRPSATEAAAAAKPRGGRTRSTRPTVEKPTVAVVLSGAAARGAFQAGALAEIIPALEREGLMPTIWLGTSAGSINAVLWGAAVHLGAETAAQDVVQVWRRMNDHNVFRPLLSFAQLRSGLQYVGGALLGQGPGTTSLLDTEPLHRTAIQALQTGQLAGNVADGAIAAVGVVATRMPQASDDVVNGAASGRSVLFLDEHDPGGYHGDGDRALDVVRGRITVDHVMASSAIPVAFPPVEITVPESAGGWYMDGGVRLNTPLHPAVGLGATRILVVSATATSYGPSPRPDPSSSTPDLADASAQVLHAVLADRTIEDLALLRRTNRLVARAADAGRPDVLAGRDGVPYRAIDVMVVSPPPGELGRIAAEVFQRRTSGLGRLSELDNWLIGKAIRGAGDDVGRRELLSYLFFDQEYFAAGLELGRRAASAALSRGWER
ncbi:MAG TPA: patatin-like phospholipase family protein [Kineosporiaceae bacterium]|nr:patatin-like phospholipase family protein [Kineosporiaceae bacterium]